MNVEDYYYNKFLEWQNKGNGDYLNYLTHIPKQDLTREFENDKTNSNEFNLVCKYLKTFTQVYENQGSEQFATLIEGIASPEKAVMELVIEATLDACNYSKTGKKLIVLAIAGLIGTGLIALLKNHGKSK